MSETGFEPWAARLTERVENVLGARLNCLPGTDSTLAQAMRYAVFNGGKRLRPLLVYASGEALGIAHERLDAPAAAVELIHCYSLVHDDLPAMDDDDLRRGQATVHLAFDEATAILAGDALQAMAFEALAEVEDATASRLMIQELARACGVLGMAGGQALDLQFERQRPDREAVEDMFRRKTGALIHAAVMMPTMLKPDLGQDQRQALSRFADTVGLAFQIRDDLLEVEEDTESIGKSCESDADREKASWPTLFGIDAARERIEELAGEGNGALTRFGRSATSLEWLADRLLHRRN